MTTSPLLKIADIPFPLYHKSQTSSTNEDVWQLLSNGRSPLLGIMADYQTAGYGRHGNQWNSDHRGNLYASFALPFSPRPDLLLKQLAFQLCDFLNKKLNIPCRLKWPNDLFLDQKKVAGMMIENKHITTISPAMVLGIGINIAHAPAIAAHYQATCLQQHTTTPLAKEKIFQELAEIISDRDQFPIHRLPELWKMYDFLTQKTVSVKYNNTSVTGIYKGMTDAGYLRLQLPSLQEVIISDGTLEI